MPTAPEHEALMRLVEAYADARHEHGAPEYNAHTMAARNALYTALMHALTQTGGWQPICEAPLDETPVDIWRPSWGGERCVNMKRVDMGGGNVFYDPVDDGPCCVRDATHFMRIPPSPAAERAQEKGR